MESQKSKIQESLEKIADSTKMASVDNHDQVHIHLGLLNIESAEKIKLSIDGLIESNNKSSEINKKAIFWSKVLTIALILVTLVVGLLQAYVIYKTSQ